jgi:hypoxanthine phosphoribosyltransferase
MTGPVWHRRRIYRLTWDGLARSLAELAGSVDAAGVEYDTVLGIARGGLPVATYLSHALAIADIRYASIRRSKSDERFTERGEPVLEWFAPDTRLDGRSVLVVDDIAGDGGTLRIAMEEVAARGADSIGTAVIVRNHGSVLEPTHYIHTADDWTWFPWERAPAQSSLPVVDFTL